MKALVTGGAGFIGSHITDELIRNGYEVIVYDNLSTGFKKNINPKAEFIKGDITDLTSLKKAIKDADYVFHLAAQISVNKSILNPKETFKINVEGTKNIISAAKENNVKKIVYSSSCAVYGDNNELPLTENALPKPLSPYAESKIKAEKLLEKSGIPFVALRYFNVYGPRQNPDSPYAAAIPIFMSSAVKGKTITIFGDGKQTRDFIHVSDVVKANLLALSKGKGVYNICSGKAVSINELVSLIAKLTNPKLSIKYAQEREGDIKHSLGDCSKARKEMGFKVNVKIKDGLKELSERI